MHRAGSVEDWRSRWRLRKRIRCFYVPFHFEVNHQRDGTDGRLNILFSERSQQEEEEEALIEKSCAGKTISGQSLPDDQNEGKRRTEGMEGRADCVHNYAPRIWDEDEEPTSSLLLTLAQAFQCYSLTKL